MHISTYMRTCFQPQVHMYISIHMYTYSLIHILIHIFTYTYKHTKVQITSLYIGIYRLTYTYKYVTYVNTDTYLSTFIHEQTSIHTYNTHVCMFRLYK